MPPLNEEEARSSEEEKILPSLQVEGSAEEEKIKMPEFNCTSYNCDEDEYDVWADWIDDNPEFKIEYGVDEETIDKHEEGDRNFTVQSNDIHSKCMS